MRVVSYVLLALVTMFLINATASFVSPAYRTVLRDTKIRITGQNTVSEQTPNKDSTEKRIVDSLDRLDRSIETLKSDTGALASSGQVVDSSGKTVSWALSVVPIVPAEPDIPLSGLFLAKLMPDITLKKIENPGIFNIFIFNKIKYTTYQDEKRNIRVYAFAEGYDTILANLKLTSSVYSINETDQFFGYTFFLNPVKKDDTIRFVTALEGHAIGVEVPKKYYSTMKRLLLK